MQELAPQTIEVSGSVDIGTARQATKSMARALGFDSPTTEEVVIVVSELATNLLKHASQGRLTLLPLREGDRAGIQIESVDRGPGIADLERAMTDGFSTGGSLGCGLGAVNRLMDRFEISSEKVQGSGTHILCERWKNVEAPNPVLCPLEFGADTRAYPGQDVNGDAFILERRGDKVLVGVIDGVGHGRWAYQAAQTARHYIEKHADQPLKEVFCGVDRACRATRGVVMALARFDWRQGKVAFASVGNIESRVFRTTECLNFIVRRGIIGLNSPCPVITEHRWEPTSIMVLHSDGVRSHWRWEDLPLREEMSANAIARELLKRLAKAEDDATVVVVKGARDTPGKEEKTGLADGRRRGG